MFVRMIKKSPEVTADDGVKSVVSADDGDEQTPDDSPVSEAKAEAIRANLSDDYEPSKTEEVAEVQRPLVSLEPQSTFDQICRSPTPRCLFCTGSTFESWPDLNDHVIVKHIASRVDQPLKYLCLKTPSDSYLFRPPNLLPDCKFCGRPFDLNEAAGLRDSVPSFLLDHDYLRTSS